MIFHFPLTYVISGRLPGKAASHPYRYAETVELDVREIAPEIAPVAVSWNVAPTPSFQGETTFQHVAFSLSGLDGGQHTRWFEGRHWQRMLHGHTADPRASSYGVSPLLTAEFFSSTLSAGHCNSLLFGLPPFLPGKTKVVAAPEHRRFDVIREDSREDAFDRLARITDDMILVDGVVYMACLDPMVRLARIVRPWGRPFAYAPVPVTYNDKLAGHSFLDRAPKLPLCAWDDIVERCCRDPGTDAGELQAYRPVVHIEDCFSHDQELTLIVDDLALSAREAGGIDFQALHGFRDAKDTEAKMAFISMLRRKGLMTIKARPYFDRIVEMLEASPINLPAMTI
jgi:hypothetical protein